MRLFPLPFDRAGMNIGVTVGQTQGRCFSVVLDSFSLNGNTRLYFFLLFFLLFSSLSLSLVLALGVVSERSIEENASWKERRERGEKNMARVLRRSNFSLHFFCPPVGEGGIADRVECRPLQMRFVGVETRALWQKIEHSNPTLSSFACHFWQETVRGLKANKIHERKTREECEERKKGRGKREGGKSRIN